MLELRLEQEQNDSTLTRASENDSCNRCVSARSKTFERNRSKSFERNTQEPSCSKCPQAEGRFTSTSSRVRQRRECTCETSASEMGNRSPPVPPERPSRMKRFLCKNGVSFYQKLYLVTHNVVPSGCGMVRQKAELSGIDRLSCRVVSTRGCNGRHSFRGASCLFS